MPLPLTHPVTLTGIGSVPGTDVSGWPSRISDQLTELPHIPELPGRGPGADMVGRTLGLLSALSSDLSAATTVTGWELAAGSRDMRRARSLLGEDLDAVERSWSGHTGLAKQQLAGPYTIAATVERKGRKLVSDPGLVRDLVEAWRVLVVVHRAELARRVPARWLIQMDEPMLPTVAEGRVETPSGLSRYAAVEPDLDLGADILHCCAGAPPWSRMRPFAAVMFDRSQLASGDEEPLAELSTAGVTLGFGVSPAAGSVAGVLDFFDRTGVAPVPMVVSPPCGMVGDYRPWVRVVEALNERLS